MAWFFVELSVIEYIEDVVYVSSWLLVTVMFKVAQMYVLNC